MNIQKRNLYTLQPYHNNPRDNSKAIPFVYKSIRDYGYKQLIVVDIHDVIIAGHTRWEALKLIHQEQGLYDEILVIVADDLTEEQAREFRIVDNQVGGIADWDMMVLRIETETLTNFNIEDFGEIKGFTDEIILAPETLEEPQITVSKIMVQVGAYKFEWSEPAYLRWVEHVRRDHATGIEDFIISRLEINESDWVLPEADPVV